MAAAATEESSSIAPISDATMAIPSIELRSGVKIKRIINGMWQTSGGWGKIESKAAVAAMGELAAAGFTSFDFADHYGPAEDLFGAFLASRKSSVGIQGFTKWCPSPGPMTTAIVSKAVEKSLGRTGSKSLDMM